MCEDFPDTDSAATEGKVFEEVTEDAAVVDDEGREVDVRAELHEGNKSNENYLNDLFIRNCFSLSLLIFFNRNIHATNCVLQ